MPQSQGPPGTEQTHGKGFGAQGQTQLIVGGSAGSCPHSLLLSGPRRGFPGGAVVKNPPVGAGDTEAQVRSLGREDSPGEDNGYPLQYSCLENDVDSGAWRATVHGVAKSQT